MCMYVYLCVYVCVCISTHASWADNVPCKNHRLTKTPVPGTRNLLSNDWSQKSKYTIKQT